MINPDSLKMFEERREKERATYEEQNKKVSLVENGICPKCAAENSFKDQSKWWQNDIMKCEKCGYKIEYRNEFHQFKKDNDAGEIA